MVVVTRKRIEVIADNEDEMCVHTPERRVWVFDQAV
jgi:hypothetical protein